MHPVVGLTEQARFDDIAGGRSNGMGSLVSEKATVLGLTEPVSTLLTSVAGSEGLVEQALVVTG